MKMKRIRRAPTPSCLPSSCVADAATKASPPSTTARFLRCCRSLLHREEGQNMVEFAFVAPLLLLAVTGVLWFGIALNDYEVMTNAASAGARAFALVRQMGQTDPCEYTVSVIQGSASTLKTANLGISWTYTPASTGTPTTYTYSSTASSICSGLTMKPGDTVQVTLTYSVNTVISGWKNNTLNLTAQTTELVQ